MANFDEIKDPNYLERESIASHKSHIDNLEAMAKATHLEVSDIKKNIAEMKDAVALEIARTPYVEKDTILRLQARLENYILLGAILNKEDQILAQILRVKDSNYKV